MTSSGMKRGLAAVAVSALAVTGLPALAGTANATPNADRTPANESELYTQTTGQASSLNDGTNTTVSLVAGGGANVTSIQFQFLSAAPGSDWVDLGPVQGRNADGVFAYDWTPAAAATGTLRAVPNTGVANADTQALVVSLDEDTVELGTEGALGVFQSPYGGTEDWVIYSGTTSSAGSVTVTDASHGSAATDTATSADSTATPGTTGAFRDVIDINGYPYSAGSEANQIVLGATFDGADTDTLATDDAEASTLYQQVITGITAVPDSNKISSPGGTSDVTVTITDQSGKPIAGAKVGYRKDSADAGTTADDETTSTPVATATDANGQVVVPLGAGTYQFYANKTADLNYNAGDPKTADFTLSEYSPVVTSVGVATTPNKSAFDFDEMDDNTFTVTVKDQEGNGMAAQPVQYRWTVDPTAAGAANASTDWLNGPATDSAGKSVVPFTSTPGSYTKTSGGTLTELPAGAYTLETRRPNVSGSGLTNATPVTYEVNESEVTFDEGTSARAPINGTYTLTGTLALIDGGSALGGRTVTISMGPGGDAAFVPTAQQPSGTTQTSGTTATAVTDASGHFSVTIKDPAVPANVTPTAETRNVNAVATALQGDIGKVDGTGTALDTDGDLVAANDGYDSEADIDVNFEKAPVVAGIEILTESLYGQAGPGKPVDLDIRVDGDATTAGVQPVKDVPVEVTVDHGFLSPNAETYQALTPAAGAGDAGDLWGVWKNDGTSKTVSTGDSGTAGAVSAIERDAGFDDDGLVTMTVTVKAGGVTETKTIQYSSDNPLNSGGLELKRMAGEEGDATVGETVELNVFAKDQFGNLAGNEHVRILDNTTVASFTTDESEDKANSDFTNDGASVIASSTGAVAQILEGRWNTAVTKHTGDTTTSAVDTGMNLVTDTETINWVGAPAPTRTAIEALLKLGNQADGDDVARVNAPSKAAGAKVKLFKVKKDGTRVLLATKTANANGNAKFVVNDKNGNKYTSYKAKVVRTAVTFADWTPTKRVR